LDDLCNPPYPLTSLSTLNIHDVSNEGTSGLEALAETYGGQISRLRLHVRTRSHTHLPKYISHFTNLRHLTLANLLPTPRRHYTRDDDTQPFAWVEGAIAAIQSPITHLTIEVLIHQPADLSGIDWNAIDVLLSTREVLRSLVQVLVVFLDKVEDEGWDSNSIAHPVTIRGLMPRTSEAGLLAIATRGPPLHP